MITNLCGWGVHWLYSKVDVLNTTEQHTKCLRWLEQCHNSLPPLTTIFKVRERMPTIPVLRMLKEEDHKLKDNPEFTKTKKKLEEMARWVKCLIDKCGKLGLDPLESV